MSNVISPLTVDDAGTSTLADGSVPPPPASGSAPVRTYWWPLWKHMSDAHGLTLMEDECNQIARAADESRLKLENVVVGILVNALQHLDDKQLVHLGHEIASRCGHTMVPNDQPEERP